MKVLENVKVGDFLAVSNNHWHPTLTKAQVTRTTAHRIFCGDVAYNRNGKRVGSDAWSREWVEPWNDAEHMRRFVEIQAADALRSRRTLLANHKWHEVTAEQAAAAIALLDSWKAKA